MKRVGLICPEIRFDNAAFEPAIHLFRASGENTGNFAFVRALDSHLRPYVTPFPWFAAPEKVREHCDILVMACANQLGAHSDLGSLADWFERVGLPIVAVGLGAQSRGQDYDVQLQAGTRRWLDVIASHTPSSAPNILVRGEFSRRQVELAGHPERAAIAGCPSNFLNPDPNLGCRIELMWGRPIRRLAVAGGYFQWPSVKEDERRLIQLMNNVDTKKYVVQAELEMMQLAREEFSEILPDVLERIRDYLAPSLSMEEFRLWVEKYCIVYPDASSWMFALSKFDLVIGARFHGVMLGIQAGIPGIVVAHDSRTEEMCQTTLVPFCHAGAVEPTSSIEALWQLTIFDGAMYDASRRKMFKIYKAHLREAGIGVCSSFDALSME